MPYYRIVIWTRKRKQPYSGIRFFESPNINAVQQICASKARERYPRDLIEVEVQMLSKLTKAVKLIIEKKNRDQ